MNQKTIVCSECGKEFIASNKRGPNPTVCSEQCRHKRDEKLKIQNHSVIAICKCCGKEFTKIRSTKIAYCSKECAHKDKRTFKGTQRECPNCRKTFEPSHKSQIYCSSECVVSDKRKYPRTNHCKECGKEYIQIYGNKGFCSAYCAGQYNGRKKKNREKTCAYCGRTYKGEGKYCSKECKELQEIKNKTVICKNCGKKFIGRPNSEYCSEECHKEAHKNKWREYAELNFISEKIICKECGKEFWTKYGNKHRVFCSNECLKRNTQRAVKSARRARIKGNGYELFDPREVLRRDKYTCQICGIKTPAKLRGTIDDSAPELDHVIPLALGGRHTRENTQCLCRKCNEMKGATPMEGLHIA